MTPWQWMILLSVLLKIIKFLKNGLQAELNEAIKTLEDEQRRNNALMGGYTR